MTHTNRVGVACVWEHNGNATMLYAVDYPGAFTRGTSLQEAVEKMKKEIPAYCTWAGIPMAENADILVVQDASCDLQVRDADSEIGRASCRERVFV